MGSFSSKNDGATLTLSVIALLIAVVFTINTFSGHATESIFNNSIDPFDKAQDAAQAGLEIAKWHIECNGFISRGSLPAHFWVNGATYAVEWDDVDLSDSTVNVRSLGEMASSDEMIYRVARAAKMKLEFLPAIKNEILSGYYSEPRPAILDSQSQ